jgi:regulator of replication initiation timing
MKSDISNAESQFAVLCSQLNSFGVQVITQYEGLINELREKVKILTDDNTALKKENESLKPKVENQGDKVADS